MPPSPVPRQQFSDVNGVPLAGAKIYSYYSGTSTPLTLFTDGALSVAHPNPAIADSGGFLTYYLNDSAYKIVVKDSLDVTQYTVDPVSSGAATSEIVSSVTGTAGQDLTTGEVVFLADSGAGLTAGRWYLADSGFSARSSQAESIGIMSTTVLLGATGTITVDGRVTGLTGLVAGTHYYVSTTGDLTATAPANVRLVGIADTTTSLILGDKAEASVRRLALTVTTVGNVGAGEDTLFETIRPGSEISSDQMGYRASFWGTTTNNANVKTVRARVLEGANNILIASGAATINQTGFWELDFEINRLGGATFTSRAEFLSGPNGAPATVNWITVTATAAADWTAAVTIRITGEATTNNDITIVGGTLLLVP